MVDGFERMIIGLEFLLEKGQVSEDSISQLIGMYTMAAAHYDGVNDSEQAELYR